MRKVTLIVLLFIASSYYCYSQVDSVILKDSFNIETTRIVTSLMESNKANLVFNKEYYKQKSIRRNIKGWIFLGLGVALFATGTIQNNQEQQNGWVIIPKGIAYQFGGLLSTIISIPFFISSGSSARKALQY